MRLVDRASNYMLIVVGLGLTLLFAALYWILTQNWPEHGIKGPEGELFDFISAVYFSVVTETTLGYGDLRPAGLARIFVCLQVFLGLAFAGIVVAKITSAHGRSVRLVSYKASGVWIEVCTMPGTNATVFTNVMISHDGYILRYEGENFDSDCRPSGFFHSRLIDGEGEIYCFRYTNKDSTEAYFKEGLANLFFQGDDGSGRWSRYQGTAHDFGTRQSTTYEGIRATDHEISVLGGVDYRARTDLIRKYVTNHLKQSSNMLEM